MKFSSFVEVCSKAAGQGYAVPAFNTVDAASARAVVRAATELKSPVILQPSVKTVRYWGVERVTADVEILRKETDIPLVLHLDHCPDPDLAEEVIRHGWSSVLIDVSSYESDEEAVSTATRIASFAHDHGASVEVEYENIIGVEDGVGSDKLLRSCTVPELVEFMDATRADVLAPQLGTAHGEYKAQPVLLPERAAEIRAVLDAPLVLHGGTGLTEEEFDAFIEAGVSKINISTALKLTYMNSAFEQLRKAERDGRWEPLDLIGAQETGVYEMAKQHMNWFHSGGKA